MYLKKLLYILLFTAINLSCEKEEENFIVFENNIEIDGESYNIQRKSIDYFIRGGIKDQFSGLNLHETDSFRLFYLGVHLSDSLKDYIYDAESTALFKIDYSRLKEVLTNYDNFFSKAKNYVEGDELECFTCWTFFTPGFSLTLFNKYETLEEMEIWTTSYGDQPVNAKINVLNLEEKIIQTATTQKELKTIVLELEYEIILFNKNRQSKFLKGQGFFLVYPEFEDF